MMKKVLAIFVLAVVIALAIIKVFESPFDAQVWESNPTQRYKLAKDIVESRLLVGKTEQEVIEMLGESNQSRLTGKHHLLYKLGKPSSTFEEREGVLVIVFEDSIVSKVALTDQ